MGFDENSTDMLNLSNACIYMYYMREIFIHDFLFSIQNKKNDRKR